MQILPRLKEPRSPMLTGLLVAAVLGAMCIPAGAQVVMVVNGDPITAYDVDQRTRLMQLTGNRGITRQQVLDDLINDRLKLSDAKRYKLEISDAEVNNAFATIARNSRSTPENFAKSMAGAGVNPSTLKARLKADLAWSQIIRGKFQASLQINEREILTALGSNKQEADETSIEYTLTPILFVAPRGSPESLIDQRKRDAELLRVRFQNCESGIPFARALRDVVVRDTVRKSSAELSPQLREILNKIEIGRLAAPEVTAAGVEVVALCNKKETTADSPAKRALREQLYSERFKAQADRYLRELRKGAMIEERQ